MTQMCNAQPCLNKSTYHEKYIFFYKIVWLCFCMAQDVWCGPPAKSEDISSTNLTNCYKNGMCGSMIICRPE